MEIENLKLYKAVTRDQASHFSVVSTLNGRCLTSDEYDIRDAKRAKARYEFLKESLKEEAEVSIGLYIEGLETE